MATQYETKLIIREELAENLDAIIASDDLHEWADGFVPVYYSEILEEWRNLDSEFTDSWQDSYPNGAPENCTIFSLMSIDLYNYYLALCTELFTELKRERGITE